MEATGEDMNLLQKIIPPKLEDAGLENCALPLHSIQEAFLKAASAVGSRGGCVADPSPDPPSDVVVGVTPQPGPPSEPCSAGKGAGLGEKEREISGGGDDDKEEKKPTLVEGYF